MKCFDSFLTKQALLFEGYSRTARSARFCTYGLFELHFDSFLTKQALLFEGYSRTARSARFCTCDLFELQILGGSVWSAETSGPCPRFCLNTVSASTARGKSRHANLVECPRQPSDRSVYAKQKLQRSSKLADLLTAMHSPLSGAVKCFDSFLTKQALLFESYSRTARSARFCTYGLFELQILGGSVWSAETSGPCSRFSKYCTRQVSACKSCGMPTAGL